MKNIVDIYVPLDGRKEPNEVVMPIAGEQLSHLKEVIRSLDWEPNVLNPDVPVSSVREGMKVIQRQNGSRFINFFAGWAYPDFSVSPMWQLPKSLPKLMLGSKIPDFPGAVGLLAASSGTAHVGITTDRLFVEDFDEHGSYKDELREFLETGSYEYRDADFLEVEVNEMHRANARRAKEQLSGQLYGVIGPRSMEMWNKIPDSVFLKHFGVARLSFDGLRLAKMAEQVSNKQAEQALEFLLEQGMEIDFGIDSEQELTREMVIFQMKAYFALLELKDQFGLDFAGVQDQLDWIQHYPATDLALGLLNNKLRPEGSGETYVTATEADDGAALTMQTLKLLTGGEPAGFNDLRYWDDARNLYWFVNSGALAPYFAKGSHDSLEGAWSERQTPMYFKNGGGTCSLYVQKPGTVTWARFSFRNNQLYLCAGRGKTDVPSKEEWLNRTERCSREWPQWYIKLCGNIEQYVNTNHPMTTFGDYLADLKAFAEEIGIPFECYDTCTPEELG